MTHQSSNTTPTITPEQRVKISLGALWGLLLVAIACTVAWTALQFSVNKHTEKLLVHDRQLDALQSSVESQRSMLVDIKGDVRSLVEAQNRTGK